MFAKFKSREDTERNVEKLSRWLKGVNNRIRIYFIKQNNNIKKMGNAATSKKGDPAENGKKNNLILDHT